MSYYKSGDLQRYFSSYSCAPQSGSMYFWQSGPYMDSDFGSHSNYTISGTIGIREQSIEAFHVTSYDMQHHLNAVEREISDYVREIIRKYQRDYPNDTTDFNISIELDLTVL
jgi:hypothetical protein